MKWYILCVGILSLTITACDTSPQQLPEKSATMVTQEASRAQEIEEFREQVNALDNPDEVLRKLQKHGRFSAEFTIVDDRLHTLVSPMIAAAQTPSELKALKKYIIPGGSLFVAYTQRDSELAKQ